MALKKFFLWLFPLALLLSANCGSASRGGRLQSWETANSSFKIRVTSYEEKGTSLPGTFYVFESGKVGTEVWREFMVLRHDDRPALPNDQIRFVNERIGFVFMGWMYAITTDGGESWSVWNAAKDVPDWNWSKYGVISDVRIEPDGAGKMVLKSIADPNRQVPDFWTTDFGRHWKVK